MTIKELRALIAEGHDDDVFILSCGYREYQPTGETVRTMNGFLFLDVEPVPEDVAEDEDAPEDKDGGTR